MCRCGMPAARRVGSIWIIDAIGQGAQFCAVIACRMLGMAADSDIDG